MHSLIRRAAIVAGATTTAIALTAGSAAAHYCYIANQSEQGAEASGTTGEDGVWFYIDIAGEFSGGDAQVAACISRGLEEAGLPQGIRVMSKVPAPHGDELGSKNPNMADKAQDGKGIDHLSDAMLGQVVGIAFGCGGTPPA